MAAGKFKATCLKVMDEVQAKREPVLLTKNGRPVAKLVPLDVGEKEQPLARFRFPGKIIYHADLIEPFYTDEELDGFLENTVRQIHGEL